jgi:molecular chaperone GrpE
MADKRTDDVSRREPTQPGAFEEQIDSEPPNVMEAEPPPTESESDSEEEARQIEEDLEQLQREFSTLSDRHLRLAAEFDNYRKRVERERADSWARAQADLAVRLLDTLDDLERVVQHADPTTPESLLHGIQLVERKLRQALESAGLESIEAQDAVFDPNSMEAVAMVAAESHEEDDIVSDVFQRGYAFKGVLLRPARVRVKKHGA